METFIAFFDVLGFKEFINNNSLAEVRRMFDHLLRETQTALSGETFVQSSPGRAVPNLTGQTINCLHVSDSIIFWTTGDSEDDFLQLVEVCYTFYWRSLQTTFPLRGCLTYGEIDFSPYTITSPATGATFHNQSLIGKGLVRAYTRADSMEYAGCLLDEEAINKVSDQVVNSLIYAQQICYYKVPFKGYQNYEHVFCPIKNSHNEVSFRNHGLQIQSLFRNHTKSTTLPESVQTKLNNTIDFLEHFRVPFHNHQNASGKSGDQDEAATEEKVS